VPDVDRLSKRPAEYLWETGVAPLSAGSCFFLLGTAILLQRILPQTDLAQQGIQWLAICFAAAVALGTRFIKDRVVSPRGGYVEPVRPKWLLWFALLSLFVPLGLVYAITPVGSPPPDVDSFDNFFSLLAPGFAVLIGVLSLYHGRMRKMLLLYGIYMLCLALLIWWLPLSAIERFGLLQSGAGGPLAVFGAMRLRAFLKANPEPVE
jgi:hypothetical protein